ncbi:hypothetical protein GIB67_020174 [Kingdonia uniflora]|uniref:Uncharacterized protein n=1 Tax=Kingdonia uniflora TaxID=39325 RepID=A0A7J7NUF9_9MAGN|nr:hypothetical protein GIB67_020174 [Kingdonia uniflora]
MVRFKMRKKDCRVSLKGLPKGVRGPLTIDTKTFKLTPKLGVVDVRKKGVDREEFEAFCKQN